MLYASVSLSKWEPSKNIQDRTAEFEQLKVTWKQRTPKKNRTKNPRYNVNNQTQKTDGKKGSNHYKISKPNHSLIK